MRLLATALAAALFAMAGCGKAAPPASESAPVADHAWVQITALGAEARLVTATQVCPAISLDGKATQMALRAGPSADFPLRVCQALLPKGIRSASVRGMPLPIPAAEPKRIVIFGDTGCRLKGAEIQDCDKPADWPFAEVVRLAAAHRPDLVIHVGDYYYRESPCPAGRIGCAGTPWGDNWASWDADFFAPAAPL
ncbi:MAG TPA: hypothetical protein VFE13_01490, partial [Caulobacteraceae bacterium]|nr:hypothetical protein [Caulobacteraceae bacterium]